MSNTPYLEFRKQRKVSQNIWGSVSCEIIQMRAGNDMQGKGRKCFKTDSTHKCQRPMNYQVRWIQESIYKSSWEG